MSFQDLDNEDTTGIPLLVDGDIVAYQAAASADGRCYVVAWDNEEHDRCEEVFKYKKDAKEYMDKHEHNCTLELIYEPEPVSHALHNVKLNMEEIQRQSPYGTIEVYLTGNENYRKQIDADYKAHRKDTRTPHHLAECKQYLVNKYGATLEEGLEADDLLGIRQTELDDSIICTLDKDLQCIAGKHYNWRKGVIDDITQHEADIFFYTQVLMGDATDNIFGLPGIGIKRAQKWMSQEPVPQTSMEMYHRAIELYLQKIPREDEELIEDYLDRVQKKFDTTAKLVWIQRDKYVLWREPDE